jgi:5-oxoprolinase (ATP-hydrolysing) subunit A
VTLRIDLNCDLGEGAGHDAGLMPLITSANIACGAHAGDAATMRATIALAQQHGVAIGAHPGFADRANFGRRELALPPAVVRALVRAQIEALRALSPVRHVKAHGALYNLAARDAACADAIAGAVHEVDAALIVFVPSNSEVARASRARGLRIANEVFADRTYQRDGSLTPRARPDALIRDEHTAVAQVLRMIREGVVRATDGTDVPIVADTVCLHGDGPDPVAFARRLRTELGAAGIEVRPFNAES